MEINSIIKTEQGSYVFNGELSEQEHSYVVQVGLCYLMKHGAVPFSIGDPEDLGNAYSWPPSSDETQ